MSMTSPLHPTGPKPQTSTNFRKNIVPSRPFAPPREAQHDSAQQRQVPSSATGPASAFGIHSRCPGQLVIHTNDYRRAVGICVVNRCADTALDLSALLLPESSKSRGD